MPPSRPQPEDTEFYVGYQRRAPTNLRHFLGRWFGVTILAVLGCAALLTLGQRDFDPGVFEYGTLRNFEGVLRLHPVPAIELDRPGLTTDTQSSRSLIPLVAFGKHGFAESVAGRAGQRVQLTGTLIYREGETIIEVASDSLQPVGDNAVRLTEIRHRDEITLQGEIVDSKCYLGVMKPGRYKSHRACATRCLSGGIPAILVVETSQGEREHLWLARDRGELVADLELLDHVAEPVRVTGRLSRLGERWILTIGPGAIERLPDPGGESP